MPVLQPAELWQQTGRYEIEELFKLEDRKGRRAGAGDDPRGGVTFHVAREVRSYRELPLILYHIQTKERDEPRPRAGVLRTREFTMKDAYSLRPRRGGPRRAATSSTPSAYDRIFDRCGLRWYRVESDVGMMGGSGAHEYMAPCAAGENEVALAPGYAANVEVASRRAAAGRAAAGARRARARSPTPGPDHGRGGLRARSASPPAPLIKAMPVIVEDRGIVLVLVRGDHRLNEIKLRNALGADFRQARAEEIEARARPGRLHRPGRRRACRCSRTRRSRRRLLRRGANEPDAHLIGVEPGRDFAFEEVDVRTVEAGDTGARRRPDRDRAGDRGRQHLQARHPLLGAARRDLPRRGRAASSRS